MIYTVWPKNFDGIKFGRLVVETRTAKLNSVKIFVMMSFMLGSGNDLAHRVEDKDGAVQLLYKGGSCLPNKGLPSLAEGT